MTAGKSIPAERDVAALLRKHSSTLVGLQAALLDVLEPLGCPNSYDKIWLLRFLLSARGDVEKAESRARAALQWRTEKSELLQLALEGKVPPYFDTFTKYTCTGTHGQALDGDYVFIIRAGICNGKALLQELSVEEVIDCLMLRKEQPFLLMDAVTRKTGRLCKCVAIIDLNYSTVAGLPLQLIHAVAQSAKLTEMYYPQFLESAVIANPPAVMKVLMSTMLGLMPKRTQEKMRMCPGNTLEDASACPFARERLDAAALPTFLGGSCSCSDSGGCIPGHSNLQTEPTPRPGGDGMLKMSVGAGKVHEVFLPVTAGDRVVYSMRVNRGTVSSGSVTMRAVVREGDGSRGSSSELSANPDCKVPPGDDVARGEFEVVTGGTAVLSFANASAVWSRTIYYTLDVADVAEDEWADAPAEWADVPEEEK
ncbi:hypothetical protein FOA52_002609 [Chlamydomonas sp. UWO 241]|nr:hypothetical protein FOA52_002609 [Chlamydomonas sp. UWO 241]